MEILEEEAKATRRRRRSQAGYEPTEDIETEPAPPRKAPRKIVREAEWNTFLIVALLMATAIAGTLVNAPSLIMYDTEAAGISEPLARIAAKSKADKYIGKYVKNSSDYLALMYAVSLYGKRVMNEGKAHAEKTHQQPSGPTSEPTNQAGTGITDQPLTPGNIVRYNARKGD